MVGSDWLLDLLFDLDFGLWFLGWLGLLRVGFIILQSSQIDSLSDQFSSAI